MACRQWQYRVVSFIACFTFCVDAVAFAQEMEPQEQGEDNRHMHAEVIDDPPVQNLGPQNTSPRQLSILGPYVSVQVNVNQDGLNILGDAANEPSIAVDPNDPNKMAIGWRQFDTIASNFRQAGRGYTQDGGVTWTFPGVLTPGTFRSDPVLKSNADGHFYYYSLTIVNDVFMCDMFKSYDGGVTWSGPVPARGGDKQWMTIDRTPGVGRGHIYAEWTPFYSCCAGFFTRSTDNGVTYSYPTDLPLDLYWGTSSVGPNGNLFISGLVDSSTPTIVRSSDAQNASATPTFPLTRTVNLGGSISYGAGPNPGGLLGQIWIGTDHSPRSTRGNIYMLATLNPSGSDPQDVMFSGSADGGSTWSTPLRINNDAFGSERYQWFGTMSVAPSGRIDVVWNDNRNFAPNYTSELHYCYSCDAGLTWSNNIAVSQPFNPNIGYPNQNKIGDYYDMESDVDGANIAYAATFNGEQDVYYLRINTTVPSVPSSYRVLRGRVTGGNLASILESDDEHLRIAHPVLQNVNAGKKQISIEFESTADSNSPRDLSFKLESHVDANLSGIEMTQTIQLFDFSQNKFVELYSGAPTNNEMVARAYSMGPPANFVQPGSNKILARATWTVTSNPGPAFPWSVLIDQAQWTITP